MSQNHGFNEPSNHRAKKFSQGKNSGSSGGAPFIPSIKPYPMPQPPPPPPSFQLDSVIDPTHDYILLRLISQDKSEGGIYLPQSAQEKEAMKAMVLKVGPGRMTESGAMIKPCCKPGDRIFMAPNPTSMIPIKAEGMDLMMVNNIMILGIYPTVDTVQSTESTTTVTQ